MTANAPDQRPVFSGGDDRLVLTEVRQETEGVKTFRFRAASGARFAFEPGQHLVVELPLPGGPEWRSFTIASPPTRPGHVELTVKAAEAGNATRFMHERLKPGATLKARAPGGSFHLGAAGDGPLVLLSAGSGATPMMAMARTLADRRSDRRVHYVHLARKASELLFRAELETIAAVLPHFEVDHLVSADDVACGHPVGRPTPEALRRLIPTLSTADVFACGPEGFMDLARAAHAAAGGAPVRFRTESFGGGAVEVGPAPAAGIGFTVEMAGRSFLASPDEPLLSACHRAGIALPSSCRNGICGTCRVLKRAGDVEMNQNGGLFDDEVEDGFVLACCSKARSNLVLEVAR